MDWHPLDLFYIIEFWENLNKWIREQGLGPIFRLLKQGMQIKPNCSWKKIETFESCFFFMFCLIVSWVFVIGTITGSQIKDFCLAVSNLGSDLRKMYPADCQTMVLSNFCNIEKASRMSKKNPWSHSKNK